jgi:hypothetical protein
MPCPGSGTGRRWADDGGSLIVAFGFLRFYGHPPSGVQPRKDVHHEAYANTLHVILLNGLTCGYASRQSVGNGFD